MNTEEKAKRYEQALERARQFSEHPLMENSSNVVEYVFPELRELDEKIRKELITHCRNTRCVTEEGAERKAKWIAWLEKQGTSYTKRDVDDAYVEGMAFAKDELEKQGEQKVSVVDFKAKDWYVSKVDGKIRNIYHSVDEVEPHINSIIDYLFNYKLLAYKDMNVANGVQEEIDWLESLRPQNWTKEDKERYISCLQRLGTGNPEQPETINSKWFKEHVYPQTTWKPSDEQIGVIEAVINNRSFQRRHLDSLYNDLKKLREE